MLPRGTSGRSIVGDLREEWSGKRPGVWRDVWYAVEAIRIALHYAVVRTAERLAPLAHSGRPSLEEALDDVRLTLYRLARNPLQLALIVIALGLGIAAPATMFTIVAGITRDLDLPEPDRLVHIGAPAPERAAPAEWLRPLLRGWGFSRRATST
jgi:hypothetical protein